VEHLRGTLEWEEERPGVELLDLDHAAKSERQSTLFEMPVKSGLMGRLWNPEIRDRTKRLHQQMREVT
jgi:hypothetical protein